MQQVKVFASHEYLSLENDVNDWIKSSGVKVITLQSNIAHPAQSDETGDLIMTVLYEPA